MSTAGWIITGLVVWLLVGLVVGLLMGRVLHRRGQELRRADHGAGPTKRHQLPAQREDSPGYPPTEADAS